MKEKEVLIKVDNLCKYFKLNSKEELKAVDHVTFDIYKNETIGIVGESGCGKTTLGRTLLGLYPITSGQVLFEGIDICKMDKKQKKSFKKKAQIILQDPYASLNPRMTVREIISEGLDVCGKFSQIEKEERVCELLSLVGLRSEYRSRYPHEFSGGQRQRIGIARTLAVEPEFIVCDEPISALDVSIQAQIINLFDELKNKLGLTYFFIAHDLAMVRYISDRVGVMYLGMIVELADSKEIYENPSHPYTKALLSAIPSTDLDNPIRNRRIRIEGEIGSPVNPTPGCRFAGRCPWTKEICKKELPMMRQISPGHYCACHLVQ